MHHAREALAIKPIIILATVLTLSGCSREAGDAAAAGVGEPHPAFDPQRARTAALRISGVRSATWVNEHNLLAVVEQNAQKTEHTIEQICMELDALGDVQAVVINLQSAAATTARELLVLSRGCSSVQGTQSTPRPAPALEGSRSPARAQHRENNRR